MKPRVPAFPILVFLAVSWIVPQAHAGGSIDGSVTTNDVAISPNGDGCQDAATFYLTFSWPPDTTYASWSLAAVGTFGGWWFASGGYDTSGGQAIPTAVTATGGQGLPDGVYTELFLSLYANDSLGQSFYGDVRTPHQLVVDVLAPSVTEAAPTSRTVSASANVPGYGQAEFNATVEPSVAAEIYADFDEALDGAVSKISVVTLEGLRVTGTSSYDSAFKRVTFNPSSPMAGHYRATAVGLDASCNVGARTWDFSVVTAPTP